MKKSMNEKTARRPRTVIERIQDKADAVAKRYHDDVDYITVFTPDDKEDENYGKIIVEIAEWGGPKMRGDKIVGDHNSEYALYDLEAFMKKMGAKLEFAYEGDDVEHHKLLTYCVVWDATLAARTARARARSASSRTS